MLDKQPVVQLFDFKFHKFQEISPLSKSVLELMECERKTEINQKSIRRKIDFKEESEEEEEKQEMEENKNVKKKIVKIIQTKSEEEDEDSESDLEAGGASLSAYEKMIEKNRAEKMAFLQSLKMNEVKADLCETVSAIKKKVQPVKRKYKRKEKTTPTVLRKSRRLNAMNNPGSLSEEALFLKALEEVQKEDKPIKIIPPEMPFKSALQFEESYENYVKDFDFEESKTELKFFSYNKSVLKKMTLDASNIAKVTPGRITTLAWYPSPENVIITAADKHGHLGIWKIDSETSPYVFKTHTEGTTNLLFNPLNLNHLVSSSYDGTVRCGDMVKQIFNEVYNVSEETCCTYFDFLSQSTYIVAQKNGQIALVDDRAERKRSQKKHICHDHSIKTVHVHPVNKNIFVTAENRGLVRLWDLRKLQKVPVAEVGHKRCVTSAYFSPVTGNSILTTSADDTICIYDSTNLTKDIKLKQKTSHNNCTGRWLSVFRATWLPNSEEAFVIGSMNTQRRIEVFDTNMFMYHVFTHENLQTITSTNAFHPCKPALAGANSSGKVVVFM